MSLNNYDSKLLINLSQNFAAFRNLFYNFFSAMYNIALSCKSGLGCNYVWRRERERDMKEYGKEKGKREFCS